MNDTGANSEQNNSKIGGFLPATYHLPMHAQAKLTWDPLLPRAFQITSNMASYTRRVPWLERTTTRLRRIPVER